MKLLMNTPLLTISGGNSGNTGTAQQPRGLQRSHLNKKNGMWEHNSL